MDDAVAGFIVTITIMLAILGIFFLAQLAFVTKLDKSQWECVETAIINKAAECVAYRRTVK